MAESLNPLEAVTVCEIQHKDYEQYLHQFPEIAIRVLKLAGTRARHLESRMEDLAFRSVSSRLANFLRELSQNYGEPSSSGIRILVRLTHQNLADMVGANRETITAIVGDFRRRGIITQNKGYLSILDKHRLTQIRVLRVSV